MERRLGWSRGLSSLVLVLAIVIVIRALVAGGRTGDRRRSAEVLVLPVGVNAILTAG
jgi:hypothetical protein